MAQAEMEAFQAAHNVTVTAVFVPFSQSRNKGDKQPSLNYVVTVQKDGRPILSTDYMMGSGHCKLGPLAPRPGTIAHQEAIKNQCEHGRYQGRSITPKAGDVLFSLSIDADVLDYGSFEDWAEALGYDTDSRKAEATYRACIEIALKLRNGLGDGGLTALREAAQDY